MIRREPTLIPMTDSDVQDVRDMVNKQKEQLNSHQQLMMNMKRLASDPEMSEEDMKMYERLREALNEKHKAKQAGRAMDKKLQESRQQQDESQPQAGPSTTS